MEHKLTKTSLGEWSFVQLVLGHDQDGHQKKMAATPIYMYGETPLKSSRPMTLELGM